MKKIDLEKEYSQRIQPLFELGREPLMSSSKRYEYEKLEFTKEDIPELLKLAIDIRYKEFEYEDEIDRFFYGTIYTVELLGKLQAIEAIEPILEKLYEDENNEFLSESMPKFFADIGEESIEILKEHMNNKIDFHLILFEALKQIVIQHPQSEDAISSILIDYLNRSENDPEYIAFAILSLRLPL